MNIVISCASYEEWHSIMAIATHTIIIVDLTYQKYGQLLTSLVMMWYVWAENRTDHLPTTNGCATCYSTVDTDLIQHQSIECNLLWENSIFEIVKPYFEHFLNIWNIYSFLMKDFFTYIDDLFT